VQAFKAKIPGVSVARNPGHLRQFARMDSARFAPDESYRRQGCVTVPGSGLRRLGYGAQGIVNSVAPLTKQDCRVG
jgi:hypothetical protein